MKRRNFLGMMAAAPVAGLAISKCQAGEDQVGALRQRPYSRTQRGKLCAKYNCTPRELGFAMARTPGHGGRICSAERWAKQHPVAFGEIVRRVKVATRK